MIHGELHRRQGNPLILDPQGPRLRIQDQGRGCGQPIQLSLDLGDEGGIRKRLQAGRMQAFPQEQDGDLRQLDPDVAAADGLPALRYAVGRGGG